MDVHYSSGVFNKAFYELAVTPDWGVEKAFKVFAWANMNCWTPDTTFQQGAECVLDEATAAHTDPTPNSLTNGEYDPSDVAAAFAVVGITLYLPEAPADITLTVSTYKVKGVNHAELTVSGVSSYDVFKNDDPNPINSNAVTEGYYTDNTRQKGGMSRSYKACDYDDDNEVCSDVVTVTW